MPIYMDYPDPLSDGSTLERHAQDLASLGVSPIGARQLLKGEAVLSPEDRRAIAGIIAILIGLLREGKIPLPAVQRPGTR